MPRRMPSSADENVSPNPRRSKRSRDEDQDDYYASPSGSSSKSNKSKISTINAAIRYRCDSEEDIDSKLQLLVSTFFSGQTGHIKFHFAKGSFVVDPSHHDLYILVHLRRSVPWTKWDKIRRNSGGDEVIMKPADSWCNFYAFLLDRFSSFASVEQMIANEDVFQVGLLSLQYILFDSSVYGSA